MIKTRDFFVREGMHIYARYAISYNANNPNWNRVDLLSQIVRCKVRQYRIIVKKGQNADEIAGLLLIFSIYGLSINI